jgi:hypothetical protein
MVKNIVTGCTAVALVILVLLAYAQKHDKFCRHGYIIRTTEPCGSVSPSL